MLIDEGRLKSKCFAEDIYKTVFCDIQTQIPWSSVFGNQLTVRIKNYIASAICDYPVDSEDIKAQVHRNKRIAL